jgi:hypothetical protein
MHHDLLPSAAYHLDRRCSSAAPHPREALKTFTARQLRLMFLLQPWNKPMSYGEQCV